MENIKNEKKIRIAIQKKEQKVEELQKQLKVYPNKALIDLRKLPDSLLQNIRKKIREAGGMVIVLKKAVALRIFKDSKSISQWSKECDKPVALILTKSTPFELYRFFKQNKKKRAAKNGEIAPFDIVIPEGDTDLPPGPALSELKAAGINVQIKAGKIAIIKNSVVAKAGEAITVPKVKALQKLNIMPFEVGINMIFAHDGSYNYTASLFNIDETLNNDIRNSFEDAFNLAVNADFPAPQSIAFMLHGAYQQSQNIAINGSLYSQGSVGQLLVLAVRHATALGAIVK